MKFSELQADLPNLTLDESTDWDVGGSKNMKAINYAYRDLYDELKSSAKIQKRFGIQKTAVTISSKIGTLPVDFDTDILVSLVDFNDDSDLDGISDSRYFEYEITGDTGTKSIKTQDDIKTLYVSYIPLRTDLSGDNDTPKLPAEIHPCIVDFGLVWYYRMIRDNIEAANALALAQQILNKKLSRIG